MSEIADNFHTTVSASVGADDQNRLRLPAGTGVARELRRALRLSDRAVRQWAATAASHGQPGHQSAYARLTVLAPEVGPAVERAAHDEQRALLGAEQELIAQMVWGIGERLTGIDTEAPPVSLQPSLNEIAVRAGEILIATGRILADPNWIVDEANDALRDLVDAGATS
jgi:hypothetical protein